MVGFLLMFTWTLQHCHSQMISWLDNCLLVNSDTWYPSVTSAEVRRAQTKSQQLVVQPCVGAWPCRLSPCELSKGSATQHTTHLPCLHCNLFRSCDKWAWRLCRCPPPHWRCRCTPARWGLACSARPSHFFLPANVTVRSVTSQQLLPSQWVAGDSVSGGELLPSPPFSHQSLAGPSPRPVRPDLVVQMGHGFHPDTRSALWVQRHCLTLVFRSDQVSVTAKLSIANINDYVIKVVAFDCSGD